MRTIVEGLAGRNPDRQIVKLLNLGGDTRLTLLQSMNEALSFSLEIPEVSRLDFAVGFTGVDVEMGDSLRFLVMIEGGEERIEFARTFDLAFDRDMWHEMSLDIGAAGGKVIRGAVGVISQAAEAPAGVTAGWSGMDLVFDDCTIERVPQGYSVDVGSIREFLSLALRTDAQELPLSLTLGDDVTSRRWIGFPAHLPVREIAVDLARAGSGRIMVQSDSTFSLAGAKTVHMGSVYPDYRLIHDSDMHIYENFAAVERGICLDRTMVGALQASGEPVLAIAPMADLDMARCGRCRIVSYEPEHIRLEVTADRDCFLLFQDMYYPGWKAYVDSEEQEYLRADVGFRVLEIAEGEHTVVMEFRPGSLKIGLALSLVGLLLTVGYAWGSGRRRRTRGISEKTA
jgi:hypothetical protein